MGIFPVFNLGFKFGFEIFQSLPGFSAAISACEKGSQWQQALAVLQAMERTQLSPNEVTFGAAIAACERAVKKGFPRHRGALGMEDPSSESSHSVGEMILYDVI